MLWEIRSNSVASVTSPTNTLKMIKICSKFLPKKTHLLQTIPFWNSQNNFYISLLKYHLNLTKMVRKLKTKLMQIRVGGAKGNPRKYELFQKLRGDWNKKTDLRIWNRIFCISIDRFLRTHIKVFHPDRGMRICAVWYRCYKNHI